jgi:UDP-N-acetyl-D-glucosamine dehydrogenase
VQIEGKIHKSVDLTDSALAEADLAVIVTQHACVDYEHVASASNRIFDTRNATRDVQGGREKIRKL